MKRIITILLAAVVCFSSCSKSNQIPATSGTINGIPATTLYGTSSNSTDYILYISSTNNADKAISYENHTYNYTNINTTNDIFIMLSANDIARGTVTTTGSKITLVITSAPPGIFISTQYTSR